MNGQSEFKPHLTCLRGVSVSAAMRLALACSNKPDDEVAAQMGWGSSVANRIMSNGDYWPSLPTLPRLCGVLGNTILAQWIIQNADLCGLEHAPMDAPALIEDIRKLMKEISDVIAEGSKALEDNIIDSSEARRLTRELEDVFTVGASMHARLVAVLRAAKGR